MIFFPKVNSCVTNPCMNGGICSINSAGQQVCTCQNGYNGNLCQNIISIGSCAINPCGAGSVCVDLSSQGGTYTCQCAANYYGRNCQYFVTTAMCNAGDSNAAFCSVWRTLGFCSFTYSYQQVPVPIYCPTSCGLCRGVSSCQDSQANCAIWANFNLCPTINARDPNLCKRSCGLCGNLIKKKK